MTVTEPAATHYVWLHWNNNLHWNFFPEDLLLFYFIPPQFKREDTGAVEYLALFLDLTSSYKVWNICRLINLLKTGIIFSRVNLGGVKGHDY